MNVTSRVWYQPRFMSFTYAYSSYYNVVLIIITILLLMVTGTISCFHLDYNYQHPNNQLQKEFQKNKILYKKSILTQSEFNIIKNEIDNIPSKNFKNEKANSVARKRIGMSLDYDSEIVRILSDEDGSLCRLLNNINTIQSSTYLVDCDDVNKNSTFTTRMVMSKVIPVELRIYEQVGSGMEWHKDDALYDPEQIEVVLTIENDSDCVTKWDLVPRYVDDSTDSNHNDINTKRIEVETEPNSAIFIQAGPEGVSHFVSSLKSGRRSILKFAFVQEDATLLDEAKYHVDQFKNMKPKKKRSKR